MFNPMYQGPKRPDGSIDIEMKTACCNAAKGIPMFFVS